MSYDTIIPELQELTSTAPKFTPRELSDPNSRYVVRSAFQKEIRRGRVDEALRMGEYLYIAPKADPWRVLHTVVVEDVGIGDLDLLSYASVTNLKGVRDHTEPEMLFAAMIVRACTSEKSQACCELSFAEKAAEIENSDEDIGSLGFEDAPQLDLEFVMNGEQSEPLGVRHLAAKALRKKLRGKGPEALDDTLEMIMGHLIDPREQRAAMLAFERPDSDGMSLALFPLLVHLNNLGKEIVGEDERPSWPEECLIKSVSSAAWDMHTLHGKRALRMLFAHMKQKSQFSWAWGIEAGTEVRALGSLLFMCEGGRVDWRLTSQALKELKQYQHRHFALGYGVPASVESSCLRVATNDVNSLVPVLNEFRKKAVEED